MSEMVTGNCDKCSFDCVMQGHETPTDEVSPYGLGSQSMQDTSGPSDFASEAATPSSQQGDPLAGSGNSGSLHSQKSGGSFLAICSVLLCFGDCSCSIWLVGHSEPYEFSALVSRVTTPGGSVSASADRYWSKACLEHPGVRPS